MAGQAVEQRRAGTSPDGWSTNIDAPASSARWLPRLPLVTLYCLEHCLALPCELTLALVRTNTTDQAEAVLRITLKPTGKAQRGHGPERAEGGGLLCA